MRRPPPSRAFRFSVSLLRPVMHALTRPVWSGGEHLPDGPFIAAVNHLSVFDPLCVGHYLVDHDVWPSVLAKHSLFRIPLVAAFMRSTGAIPVRRLTSSAGDALVAAEEAVAAGRAILLFPEGTTTQDPELWPMTPKSGLARLALRTGVPVIPIAQWGAQRVVPTFGYGFHPFPRKEVVVVAGPPVDLDDLAGRADDPDAWREATDRVLARLTAGLSEIRGEAPPEQRFVRRPHPLPRRRRGRR